MTAAMEDRPAYPYEKTAGHWCLPCANAAVIPAAHACRGPVTVQGRRYQCTCQEHGND